MNIKDIVENELTQIRDNSRKYPQLCKVNTYTNQAFRW